MSLSNRRRTPAVTRPDTAAGNALTLKTNMTLRKSSTFHSPTSPSASASDHEGFVPPRLVRRSQTNLDDVVDAHRRRVALIVDNIDKSLSKTEDLSPSSALKKVRFRDNSLPVPRGFLDLPVVDPAMANDNEPQRRVLRPRNRRPTRHQASDSGLGSSLTSTKEKAVTDPATKEAKTPVKASAITRSAATSTATMDKLQGLSSRAVNRVHEHILRPLRAKPSLKDFEPIVLDIPRRIRDKEIICLRDLEKTLIFMAPERTKTAALYLDFCLTSIRCIQLTVEYLTDREQTRPSDRPYTNGYFIDLVEQIRQYAKQLAAAKEKQAVGEGGDSELDASDEVKLFGGFSKNGQPAQLVRVKKDGKAISIATGEPVELDDEDSKSPIKMKRSLSEQLEDEEEIMRSMARRKKNASPEELAPKKCREPGCNKEFKRPCDLTKHEKTHSRPWKCPVPTCKYHDYGWPTEKEMDRHHNDKHSSAPPMYECLYKPCPYKSKRESNCKQHMEKAHGWTYVRTKTNGKKPSSNAGSTAQETPQLRHASTPSNSLGIATPPEDHPPQFMPINEQDYPVYISDEEFLASIGERHLDLEGLDEMVLDLSPINNPTPSTVSSYENAYAGFQDGPDFVVSDDIYTAHAQLPTPDHALFGKILQSTAYHQPYHTTSVCQAEPIPAPAPLPVTAPAPVPVAAPAPHISPIGQGNAMLYTPQSMGEVDEGFEDFPCPTGFRGDFQLFPSNGKMQQFEPLFAEVPSAGLGFSQPSQDMFQQMDWAATAEYQQYHEQH